MKGRSGWADSGQWTQDSGFHQEIEEAVGRAEERSSAELVVVVSGASGSYRDIDYLAGSLFAFLALVAMFWSSFYIHELAALLNVLVFFLLGAAACNRWTGLRRWLSRESRRRDQVLSEARRAFYEEAVRATAGRSGVLLFVSVFEREVAFLPDLAVEGRLAGGSLRQIEREIRFATDPRAAFVAAIGKLSELLEGPFPVQEGDRDEIPNAPRIRS